MSNILNMPGQINLNTSLGLIIYDLVKTHNFKNIVDVGTWNGMGTTTCIMRAIDAKKDTNAHIYTVELYPEMINYAQKNLKKYTDHYKLHLLEGAIATIQEVYSWFDHASIDMTSDGHARLWYEKDMKLISSANNVLNLLPNTIDLLILDGGEYSTYPEWQILKNRTQFFVLDDTNLLKCSKIRKEILSDPKKYTIIRDATNERNGFMVGRRNA